MSDLGIDLQMAGSVSAAVSDARRRTGTDQPLLHTGQLLAALADVDLLANWERVWLMCGYPSRDDIRRSTDPEPEARNNLQTWDGAPVSATLADSLALLSELCGLYSIDVVQPGMLAIALIADSRSGAATALLARGELAHDDLLELVQDEILGTELSGLNELIREHVDGRSTATSSDGLESGCQASLEWQIENKKTQIAGLEKSAQRALLRADAARELEETEVATRFDEAALKFAEQLVQAERARDDLSLKLEHAKSAPPPETTSVFVSYSRHDYYFAEALHAELSKQHRLEPWMDVRNLGLAEDWSESIDEALRSADVLVLVASNDAFASKQVEREWRHAIKRGIPVLIIIARRCRVAAELAQCGTYDLRSRFASEIRRLREDIVGERLADEPVRAVECDFFYRPPASISVLLGILSLEVLLTLFTLYCWIYVATSSLNPTSRVDATPLGPLQFTYSGISAYFPLGLNAAVVALIVAVPFQIFSHRVRLTRFLSAQVVFAGIMATLAPALILLGRRSRISDISLPPPVDAAISWPLFSLVAGIVLASAAMLTVAKSAALYRCAKTGYATAGVRRRVIGESESAQYDTSLTILWQPAVDELVNEVASRRTDQLPAQRTFRIICDPRDREIGRLISDACTEVGLTARRHGYWQIIVVTNLSDLSYIESIVDQAGARGICVLATGIDMPADADVLRRRQWLDFRVQNIGSLQLLLRAATGHPTRGGVSPVPVGPRQFRAPLTVTTAMAEILFFVVLAVGVAIGLLSFATQTAVSIFSVTLALAFAGSFTWIYVGLASRRLTIKQYVHWTILNATIFLLGFVMAVTFAAPGWLPASFYIVLLLVFSIRRALAYRGLRKWWLLTEPADDSRVHRVLPEEGIGQGLILAGLVVSLIFAATAVPATELYIKTPAESGALYPPGALPTAIRLTNHDYLSDLQWVSVADESARAVGILNELGCIPSCAEGAYSTRQVEVLASAPAECRAEVYPDYSSFFYTVVTRVWTVVEMRSPEGDLGSYAAGGVVTPGRCG